MSACKIPSNVVDCNCSDDKIKLAFNSNKNFTDKNNCQQDNELFKNIKLSDLANRIESYIQKVKEFELFHLIEPITSAANKLRLLDEFTEKIACDCNYGDYVCDAESCYDGISVSSIRSADSCLCCDANGMTSCHCGSEKSFVQSSPSKEQITATADELHKTNTYSVIGDSKNNDNGNPCRCAVDKSFGKRIKMSECKLASKARRVKEQKSEDCDKSKACTANERLKSCTEVRGIDEFTVGGQIGLGGLNVQATFTTKRIVNDEGDDFECFVTCEEKINKGISCDLSEESRSECFHQCHKDEPRKDLAARRKFSPSEYISSQSSLGSRGCGQCDDDDYDDEGEICPCGCDDMMGPFTRSYAPRYFMAFLLVSISQA